MVVVVLVPAGLAWLCMLATMNGNLSMFLPGWVRARGLSIYQMVFAGGQALAAIAWGVSAQWLGLVPTLLAAAVLLGLGAVSVAVLAAPGRQRAGSQSRRLLAGAAAGGRPGTGGRPGAGHRHLHGAGGRTSRRSWRPWWPFGG